jgi:hypothetical protein
MNTDRDDGDLRHVFMESAGHRVCHLCLKPKAHPDHVPYSITESFARELPKLIEEARR